MYYLFLFLLFKRNINAIISTAATIARVANNAVESPATIIAVGPSAPPMMPVAKAQTEKEKLKAIETTSRTIFLFFIFSPLKAVNKFKMFNKEIGSGIRF